MNDGLSKWALPTTTENSNDGVKTAVAPQYVIDAPQVETHSALADSQLMGDVGIPMARRYHHQSLFCYLALSLENSS